MNQIHYVRDALTPELIKNVMDESLKIPWCKPPAGIPGNHPPRNVCVLGDGSSIKKIKETIYRTKKAYFPKNVSYPLFQCYKSSTAHYEMRSIPKYTSQLILKLREIVKEKYGRNAVNVDNMFNVVVCNYYTEDSHRISDHRDDERWLEFNELDNIGNPVASIIASLTLYIDDIPEILRNFELYNEELGTWEKNLLEHNSLIFFSNHRHRAKPVGKRGKSCKRINFTFRTLTDGLLGLTGYGNFYRYMSLPYKISIDKRHKELIKYYQDSIEYSNNFNSKKIFNDDIQIVEISNEIQKVKKQKLRTEYLSFSLTDLPRYVKSLCSDNNYENYMNFFKKKSKFIIKKQI